MLKIKIETSWTSSVHMVKKNKITIGAHVESIPQNVICIFFYSANRLCVLIFKANTKDKHLHNFAFSIFPISIFLGGLKFIFEFWYFAFLILSFMAKEGMMSKSGIRHYNSFTENLGHMDVLGWLGAQYLELCCL